MISALFGNLFFLFFMFPFVFAIASMIYRSRAARRIAARAGLNGDDAAATAFWDSGGLDTAYLAATLRAQTPTVPMGPPRPTPPKTVEARLADLDRLKREGMITQREYDAQRKTIVSTI